MVMAQAVPLEPLASVTFTEKVPAASRCAGDRARGTIQREPGRQCAHDRVNVRRLAASNCHRAGVEGYANLARVDRSARQPTMLR